MKEGLRTELEGSLERLRKRQAEIATRDFFQATGQLRLGKAIAALEASLSPSPKVSPGTLAPGDYLGRTWVTRSGIHVDRMACAWLIRRFIDPKAKLKFVAAKGHHPAAGELHFDMFEGEFTHQGDLCSFEVFLQRFGLEDSGLRWLAEIVHDIDVKDGKFGRDEVAGVAQMVVAIASAHPTDDARLQRASALFDDLYQLFKRARV